MFVWLLWLSVALAEPTAVQVADGVTVSQDAAPAVKQAFDALAAGKFEDAARQLGALADASPKGGSLRYLEALARYQQGDLRHAARAAEQGLAVDPSYGPLLNLHGLILADQGRGEQALDDLERARTAAVQAKDVALQARVALNEALLWMDRGDLRQALSLLERAQRLANAAGSDDVLASVKQDEALIAQTRGNGKALDLVGEVADHLRRGEVDAAKKLVPAQAPAGRRAALEAKLAEAAVQRAEGHYDAASATLQDALLLAREGGLERERARVLGELGTVHLLAGRDLLAREHLREALDVVQDSSFTALALGLQAQAGLVDVRLGDLKGATEHLEAGRRLAHGVESPMDEARLDELAGAVAAEKGDVEGADAAWQSARDLLEKRGWWMDAARVETSAVRFHAAKDLHGTAAWEALAAAAFDKAGDPLGPARIGNARGLGQAERGDLEGALTSFAKAAEDAQEAKTSQGDVVATLARRNAAEALRVLGHGEEAAKKAAEMGLDQILAQQRTLAAARTAWKEGMTAWDKGDWKLARQRFDSAYMGFRELGEKGYAQIARRDRAWAAYNLAVGLPAQQAFPYYEELVQEAIQVEDPELRVRARSAQAIAATKMKGVDPSPLLRTCADDADSIGMEILAARCWAALADQGDDLDARARFARKALAADKGGDSVYAMYSAAVDAYNAGNYDLAIALTREVQPSAGDLADAVTAVLQAARQAQAGAKAPSGLKGSP